MVNSLKSVEQVAREILGLADEAAAKAVADGYISKEEERMFAARLAAGTAMWMGGGKWPTPSNSQQTAEPKA